MFEDFYFTTPHKTTGAKIHRYQVTNGQISELERFGHFDFNGCQTIQLGRFLFSVSDSNLQILRFDLLRRALKVQPVPDSLSKDDMLFSKISLYSLAGYRNEAFFVVGGMQDQKGNRSQGRSRFAQNPVSKDVYAFTVKENRLEKIARLRDGRHSHSSCTLKNQLYVFGGLGPNAEYVNSIESAEVSDLFEYRQGCEW